MKKNFFLKILNKLKTILIIFSIIYFLFPNNTLIAIATNKKNINILKIKIPLLEKIKKKYFFIILNKKYIYIDIFNKKSTKKILKKFFFIKNNIIFNKNLNKYEIFWNNIKKNSNKNNYLNNYNPNFYLDKKKKSSIDYKKKFFYYYLTMKNNISNNFSNKEVFIENIKLNLLNIFNNEINNKIKLSIYKIFNKFEINGKSLIRINLDENLNLNNSEASLLLPLIENENYVFFLQNNIHETDNRIQNNLGFGIRKISIDNNYLFGINSFLDYDISLENTRIGIGGEFWKEFLKLNINIYYGLSRWWHSNILNQKKTIFNNLNDDDFFSRPATGWDFRIEGYFPKLPELIFNFDYSKYFGNIEFKKENYKKLSSPSILSFSINYNPIPFLNFTIQKSHTFLGQSNLQFGININLNLNSSFYNHIHTKINDIFSSSYDHKYDFVNRNNNIFLESRKKYLIKLSTKKKIIGFPRSEHFLGLKISSVNNIKNTSFKIDNVFYKQGGSIRLYNHDYIINMPSYDFENIKNNTLILKIIVDDVLGNKKISYVMIKTLYPLVNKNFSTLSVFPKKILVNSEEAKIVFEARDNNNELLTNMKNVHFIVEKGNLSDKHNIHFGHVTEDPKGTYFALITSSSAGQVSLKVKIGDVINKNLSTKINFISPSVDNMVLKTNPQILITKVSQPITFLITVYDKHGKRFKFSNIQIRNVVAKDRQGDIRKDSGKIHIEDITNQKSDDNDNFLFTTDINGELKLKVSDPHGIGVRTTLEISANDYITKTVNLIFTVSTSPNTPRARMYGHMTEFLFVNGIKFKRPILSTERLGDQVNNYLNEDWSKFNWYNAESYCKSQNSRLPTKSELLEFYNVHSGDDLLSNYGWPIVDRFNLMWTSTPIVNMYFRDPLHFHINFLNGDIDKGITGNIFSFFCVQDK
ncbi:inverse autotransporter beta domain-containing protein [Enterobacteriaceae endosymbiont of Donacia fulgens]|uniref:inverse autotransporter beta domain-containing protein n=1 Tax=Enterobacteriaceae endosymbiont of Donacia fulgens TaxID=2675778 RepID=UPI001B3AF8DB|nr:inverse autotransporter beta domain-containing protein [Enterobacteriaceae endosymbiont of Donacia fulgens]